MKPAILAVFCAVFLWHLYRAATTAITPDEAVTYNGFVSQPVLKIVSLPYNPQNQVLHSLLCHLVLRVLRITEFSLRVASLLGLLFYFWQAFRLVPPLNTARSIVLCAFAANPLTIGWLPQSTGFWMAAGIFLLAVRKLTRGQLPATSIALGIAGCFYVPFCVPAVLLIFWFLHVQFWRIRRVSPLESLNCLVLPAALILFCLWILPIVNAPPGSLTLSKLVFIPNRFRVGPGANLPHVARELRDEIRRHPPRPIRVSANPLLVDQLLFYRRRYALGAVNAIVPIDGAQPADYSVVIDSQTGRAKLNATTLVDIHH